jgi:2-polyprenyl-6-methoxyphenol hydroxylase-like FAD-dependent oxidoreductase
MFGEDAPEVLVVGAGPVGQFAALALARRGVRVRIVDRGVWPCAQSYALALHSKSIELLEDFGLGDAMLDAAHAVDGLSLYDASKLRAEVKLTGVNGAPGPIVVLRQDMLEGLLEDALKVHGVRVEWRHEVSRLVQEGGHAAVTIDRFEKESRGYVVAHTEWALASSTDLEVPFVIGADGYNSRVRRALNLDFHEVGPAQYFAVFEFKSDAGSKHDMRVVLGDQTTDVLWPLPGGAYRWSFELPDYRDVETESRKQDLLAAGFDFPTERSKERLYLTEGPESAVLTEANLRALIAARAPWFTASVDEIVWKSVVRFERRLAGGFGKGRMWLAGDAAHLTGPVGIQSMNLGLEEAHDLAGAIAGILRNAESPSALEDYGRRWMATWRSLHNLEGGLSGGPLADEFIRGHAGALMSCLPGHGETLAAMAAQLGLSLAKAQAG